MQKLRISDPIIVIAGKWKGKISTIEKIDGEKVRLKDVNVMKKAKKGEGFIKKTLPINISNIMYYLQDKKKGSKIGIKINKDGKKQRIVKASGETLK